MHGYREADRRTGEAHWMYKRMTLTLNFPEQPLLLEMSWPQATSSQRQGCRLSFQRDLQLPTLFLQSSPPTPQPWWLFSTDSGSCLWLLIALTWGNLQTQDSWRMLPGSLKWRQLCAFAAADSRAQAGLKPPVRTVCLCFSDRSFLKYG